MKLYIVKYLIVALAIVGLFVGVAQANGPNSTPMNTAFTYQGRLSNGGMPVNGRCDFKFTLLGMGSQQSPTLDKPQVPVRNGLFTVSLNFGNDATWNGRRSLQIAVRCPAGSGDFTTLSPIQPLTPAPFALALPGLWTQLNSFYSPNIIAGSGDNSVAPNVVGATIAGGGDKRFEQHIFDHYGTIGGGRSNQAGNDDGNVNSAIFATVAGGSGNVAEEYGATVGGGEKNYAVKHYSSICGGYDNFAGGAAAVAGGGNNSAKGDFAFIGGGSTNAIDELSFNGVIAGGRENVIKMRGDYSIIGGGKSNVIEKIAKYATVGGGDSNAIGKNASYATIGGGFRNKASASRTTIAGGEQNTAKGYLATIGGGFNNVAGFRAVVGGGDNNQATGARSVIPGGGENQATGDYSFAAGRRAKAIYDGCFVWGDASDMNVTCQAANQTLFRSTGGFKIYTNRDSSTGVYLSPSGHSWNQLSDRDAKENFRGVDADTLLERLARIEISTWNYKDQGADIRHIGPTAQDFNALLPDLGGEGETYINAMDADGVALAAIQGLYQRWQQQEEHIAELEEQNAALQAQLADLTARLAALEAIVHSQEEAGQ